MNGAAPEITAMKDEARRTEGGQPFRAHMDAARRSAGAEPEWYSELRRDGAAWFNAEGLPTTRDEDWKYTNLSALAKLPHALASPSVNGIRVERLPTTVAEGEAAHRLVFVNGWYRADLSRVGNLPAGVEILSLAQAVVERPDLLRGRVGALAPADELHMVALNTALMSDGLVLKLGRNALLEHPLVILSVGDAGAGPVAFYPRHLIIAEAGSQATVVEHHIGLGEGSYFANSVTEIAVEDGAVLRHCKIQDDAAEAYHIATTSARVAASGNLDSFAFALGARLSRNEIRVRLEGPSASCRLNGGYLMKDKQHTDTTTVIEHVSPHTSSRETYKGVLDDRARAVFQGRIVVHQDAQKSDGQQLNKTLLLSNGAEIDTKPSLEISADDVKCSHGATTGELDDRALFYLRSRGIPVEHARRLLVEAFLGEVIDGIALAGLREPLERMVARWMNA